MARIAATDDVLNSASDSDSPGVSIKPAPSNGEELKMSESHEFKIEVDDSEIIKYGIYRCVFKEMNDSLYIQMKNHDTKRTFCNLFNKEQLLALDLKQPSEVVVSLLKLAQSGEDSNIAFAVNFGNIEGVENTPKNKLRDSFQKGDSLYVCVDIKQSWHTSFHNFKLFEQHRSETDKIYDIIADMKEDNENKNEEITPAIAVYKRTTEPDANLIALDEVTLAPTRDGVFSLADDKKNVVIAMKGIYRITATLNWTAAATGCAGDTLEIRVNDEPKTQKFAGCAGGVGTTEAVLNLKQGDKVSFFSSCNHATSVKHNSFVIQKV